MPIRKLMEQLIIERLLRARIYRTSVRLRTGSGEPRDLLVRDVCYDGSNSVVVVAAAEMPRTRFTIPLKDVTLVELPTKAGVRPVTTLDDAVA